MRVYAISDQSGRVKIGIAKDAQARLRQLQTGNPQRLELVADNYLPEAAEAERLLHKYLGAIGVRLVGEWFEPCLPVSVTVATLAASVESGCIAARAMAYLYQDHNTPCEDTTCWPNWRKDSRRRQASAN